MPPTALPAVECNPIPALATRMNVVTGDLLRLALDGRFDVIVHGCNCQCAMGKGIALSIKQQFPEAYDADLHTQKGDRAKLGW